MADLADMIQKAAFYQAGGKDPGTSDADQFNQGADIVTKVIGSVLAIKKAQYENQKTQAETGKLGSEKAAFDLANTPSSNYMKSSVAGTSDAAGNAITSPQPPSIDLNKMTIGQRDTLSQENLRNAQAEEARRKATEKTGGVHRIINKANGKVVAEYPSSPGSGDTFHLVGEETLPTYTKSEILKMSPEARALLGKYKLIDDTASGQAFNDNQTIDSIIAGIGKLGEIRKTMGSYERGATLIPGASQAGKLVSAPLSAWQTEKDLLAQRLGKLVEKNRMSDSDRVFYLKQFNSPASTDPAFEANISSLVGSLQTMKKSTTQSPQVGERQTKDGVEYEKASDGLWYPVQ